MTLTYDHSFEGFLTAVFEVYEYKYDVAHICKEGYEKQSFFNDLRRVITHPEKADRVFNKLKKLMGDMGIHYMLYSILTEDECCEKHMLSVIRYAIAHPTQNILKDMSHPDVLQLAKYTKMVGREKHRMEAFVRFRLTRDGIYFAEIEPDFNVLPIIAKHFYKRYQDQKWLIFDRGRNYGIYYDGHVLEQVSMKFNPRNNKNEGLEMLAKDEEIYQDLWRTYFDKTNIKARKNMRLHVQHVPKRYWKYLTEKQLSSI